MVCFELPGPTAFAAPVTVAGQNCLPDSGPDLHVELLMVRHATILGATPCNTLSYNRLGLLTRSRRSRIIGGMTNAQTLLRKLLEQQSTERGRMAELSATDLTDETRAELKKLQGGVPDLELKLRAARLAVEGENGQDQQEPDAEMRERMQLRSTASLGKYLHAAMQGRLATGPEAELRAAAGVGDGSIPMELWGVPKTEDEKRVISEAPSNSGVNLAPLRPAVFAPSVAGMLGIAMPTVQSGTYSTGTINQSVTADAVAKSAAVPETAATFSTETTTSHRIGSSLRLTLEDIATVGQGNFESILRQNVSLSLSDHVDENMLNGSGGSNELTGIFQRLTNATAPASGVESWTRFLAVQSSAIDGLWASELSHVMLLVGVETYRLAAATFQGTDSEDSAASYMKRMGAGFSTNSRMPAKASHIQKGIACRKGRTGLQLAVCPVWFGSIAIDDIYSGASKGERVFTLSTLVGDVILQQPDAYREVAFRVSV